MSGTKVLEKTVLSAIALDTALLDDNDVRDSDFEADVNKRIFFHMTTMHEEDRLDHIDITRLVERCRPDDIDAVYVASLIDAPAPRFREDFPCQVLELRKARLQARVAARINEQARLGKYDVSAYRAELEEIDRLSRSGAGTMYLGPQRQPFVGGLADFFAAELPEAEVLIDGLLARQEFMLLGGVKHAHKTTTMMGLGLSFADGRRPWLNFKIPKPGRFLMVQQELGEGEFRKRLKKAVQGGQFDPDNFFPYTGTGDPIKLMDGDGFKRLCDLCDKFKPDILGLDPLHTFMVGGENRDEAFAGIRDRINYFKTTFNCGVITSHHFSSKRPKDDPDAPAEAAGWFRGHSVLADAADVLFLLHRLPGQRDNPNLRLAYEDYNQVEITLRNGKWPPKFATEFHEDSFILNVSDVWHEVGAKIGFGEVRDYCEAQGGSARLADLVTYFKARDIGLSPHTVKNAVDKEESAGYIVTERLPGKGHPILVKSRKAA